MKKNLIIKQDGSKDCGAASLLSIIRYYKGNISINKLIELTNTTKTGTNFLFIKEAAESLGLDAVGYKVNEISSLIELNNPFICQLIDKNYEHFVVVYEIKKDKIIIMDPAIGKRIILLSEFSKIFTGYIMLFSPRKKLIYHEEKKYLNKVIIDTIIKNKSIVLYILLLSIIFTIVSCTYTMYLQIILDKVINTTKNNLLVITFFFAMISLIKCVSEFMRTELLIYLNQKLDCTIFLKTIKRILLLPYSYYKNRTTGEMISRINDLIYVKNIINKIILTVFLDVIILICCSILLASINSTLFLFLVMITILYLLIFYIFRPSLKRLTEQSQQNNALINSFLVESINGYETNKNLNLENIINMKMEKIYTKALNDNFIYDNLSNLEMFIKDIISLIGILLIEYIGFNYVIDNNLSLGTLLTFILLSNYFIEPIKNMINLSKEYYYAVNSIKRVNHLLDIDIENFSNKKTTNIQGNIKFNNLSFSYNTKNLILKNINLDLKKGEKMIILGSSGSGKSTILKLLLKYYQINRDMLYIDNIDLNDIELSDIRSNISCISQNEILYTDTIKNNIILNRNISDEEFYEVCRLTKVDGFVKNLFLGYDTKLEENGLNLSGGQRQRIILARMLLKKSKILLIDEGLNAIDINLERQILKNIFSKYNNKTIIIISHRKENLDLFNKIVSIEQGTVQNILTNKEAIIYDR